MANIPVNLVVTAVTGSQDGFRSGQAGMDDLSRRADMMASAIANSMKQAMAGASSGMQGLVDSFIDKLANGFAIDLTHRFNNALVGIQTAMVGLVRDGVAFNETLESTTIGIAAVLKQTDRVGNFKTFGDAMTASGVIIKQLKQTALETSASFTDLATGFQTTTAQMTMAGIPLKNQVEMMKLMANSIKNILGPMFDSRQLMTEARALLQGETRAGATLAQTVFARPEDKVAYQQAKDAGMAFEFFQSKLSAADDATKYANLTFNVLKSNLGDIKQQLMGQITLPLFTELKSQMMELTAYLQSGVVGQAFSPVGRAVADMVGSVGSVLMKLGPLITTAFRMSAPAFDIMRNMFTAVSDTVGSGIDKISAMITGSDFAGRWKQAMMDMGAASLGVVDALRFLTTEGMNFIQAIVSNLPEMVRGFAALAPVFTLVIDGMGLMIKVTTALIDILTANHTAVVLAMNAAIAFGLVLAVFSVVNAVSGLIVWTEGLWAAAAAATGATGAIGVLTGGIRMLGVAMVSNPMGAFLAVLTGIVAVIMTKLNPAIESSYNNIEQLEDRLMASQRRRAKEKQNALEKLKANPVEEPANSDHETENREVIAAKADSKINDLHLADIKKNEALSYEERLAQTKYFLDEKDRLAQEEYELEFYMLTKDLEKAAGKEKEAIETKITKLNEDRRVQMVSHDNEYANSIDDLMLKEIERTKKITDAGNMREWELEKIQATTRGDYDAVKAIQSKIDLERELNKILSEQDITRKKFTSDAAYKAAVLQARNEAQRGIDIRNSAGSPANAYKIADAQSDTQMARANAFGSPNSMDASEHQAITEKMAATQSLIDLKREEMAAEERAGNKLSDKYTAAAVAVEKLNQEMVGLEQAQERVGGLADQMSASLREWAQSVGSTFHQIAGIMTNTVKSAFSGVAQSLTSVIMGTQSVGQAFSQMALQMATSFIASVIEMILISTVAIPILTALGILSGGGTVSTGLAVTTAGLAAGASMAGTYATYADGGLVPGSPNKNDTVPAWLSNGEHVMQSPAVSYYGAGLMDMFNNMRIPREQVYAAISGMQVPIPSSSMKSHFADGGLVGTVPSGGQTVNVAPAPLNLAILDDRNQVDRYFESTSGQKRIIHMMNRNRRSVGMKS